MNNHVLLWQKRTTAVFEFHDDALHAKRYDESYKTWLRQPHEFPIYMHETHPEVPASVKYPRCQIAARFGDHLLKGGRQVRNYYTSTFPYMLALALHLGYKRVECYGVDLDHKEEYADHRDSVFLWIGKATALGMDVWIPEDSVLYDEVIYP